MHNINKNGLKQPLLIFYIYFTVVYCINTMVTTKLIDYGVLIFENNFIRVCIIHYTIECNLIGLCYSQIL